ncbi:MAG: lipopolysaccharide heptosyltransferase I [Verrucomicrobia bacterium]|nr:lipopolysaccharide heptosyltransferase I [Verrucomicrobiota bacterium]
MDLTLRCAALNILIVKMSAIGDVIHTLPALTTLRRHQPEAQITWLVEEAAAEIIRGHAALNRVLVWPRRQWVAAFRQGRFLALLRQIQTFLRELRDTEYDLVIDFQALAKSALWVALARGKRKAGYGPGMRHDERSYLVLNERVPVTDPNAHAIERNLRLLEGLGFARTTLDYGLPLSPADDTEARALLKMAGMDADQPFVAINALTRWPTKNWTEAGFACVADALAQHHIPCVFTGARGDAPALDAVATQMRTPIRRLDGRTSLKTLAAVFHRAAVVVSTDTGPMHLAVAAGTPVIALFGPTSPGYTGPYGAQHTILRAGVECSPCFKRGCETTRYEKHACMRRIPPKDVIAAVLQHLKPGEGATAHDH